MQRSQIFSVCCVLLWTEMTAKEFCHNEQFIASCPDGEVVVMTGAQYGRMQIGSCVKTGFGFPGCYVDAIAHAHERCSGRPTCSIRVPDAGLDKMRPCNDDLKSYLDANFTCVKVATHEDCVVSTSESLDQQQYVYLSNRDFPNTSGKTCGSVESPWTIRALPGQRINVTLIDFSSVRLQSTMIRDSLSLKPTQTSVSEQCDRYAVIYTRSFDGSEVTSAAGKAFVVCGNQKREWPSTHVYISANNIISVEITKRNEPSYNFLLKFKAIGCPKLDSPGNIRLTVSGSGTAVHCIDSGDVWYLTCDGTRWNGTLDNCTAGMVVGQAPEHPVAPATIHVELFPETVVMPGTNVTVTCRVHRSTVDVWPNVVLSKAVIAHDATVPREAIVNNADLTPFYAKMGRFEISKNSNETDLIFTLKITGVSVNDSGQYACADSTENQYDGKPLEVYRPPELPYFLDQSYHRIADDFNDTLNLIEGESSDFGCRVPNVFPTPDVNIYVNKVKSQKLEDVTPNFLITEEQNIRCTENVGMKACPLHVSYDMLVVNKDFKPTYEHDEQTLTCSATMRQFSRDGQKIQIKMNVEYKPKIQCTPNTVTKLNETNKIISCLIQSNPPVPHENKTWLITHEGISSLLGVGEISDEYKVEEKIYEHTGGKLSDLTLTINRVTAKTFLTQFKIMAENELGSGEQAVKVTLFKPTIKGGAPGIHGSNSSLWKILSIMAFLMMMICFSEFH